MVLYHCFETTVPRAFTGSKWWVWSTLGLVLMDAVPLLSRNQRVGSHTCRSPGWDPMTRGTWVQLGQQFHHRWRKMKENNNEDKIQICSFPILLKYPRQQKEENENLQFPPSGWRGPPVQVGGFHPLLPASLNQDSIKSWNSQSILTRNWHLRITMYGNDQGVKDQILFYVQKLNEINFQ